MRPCGFFLGFDYYVRVLQVSDFYLKGILFSHISDVLNIFLSFFFQVLILRCPNIIRFLKLKKTQKANKRNQSITIFFM